MTRYARSGNSQKHQKVPGDATPWEAMKASAKEIVKNQKSLAGKKNKPTDRTFSAPVVPDTPKQDLSKEIKSKTDEDKIQLPIKISGRSDLENVNQIVKTSALSSGILDDIDTSGMSSSKLRRLRKKRRIQGILAEKGIESKYSKHIDQKKKQSLDSQDTSDQDSKSAVSNNEQIQILETSSPKKKFSKGKNSFLDKIRQNRAKNGIILLSDKMENKIYKIKRSLREKGVPSEAIREIIRKVRRKEENNFRKASRAKPCFNCRKTGHYFADCPVKSEDLNQETGICFKCGSSEHVSYKCPKRIEGFPLAKCFVCKEQGHITKDCPKNDHGVYPDGGKCFLCGNINHFRKDCPSIRKKAKEEVEMTAHTINEVSSVDAEIIADSGNATKQAKNKRKIVKF